MKLLQLLSILSLLTLPALAARKDKEASVPDVRVSQVKFGTLVNDVEFDQGALEGKVVVIEEWSVNCPACIASLPDMAKLAKRYQKKGLVVVGLERQGSSSEAILEVIKRPRVKYPIMSGGSSGVPSNGIPHACVFGHDGKLVWHGHPASDDFEDAVKDALKAMPKV